MVRAMNKKTAIVQQNLWTDIFAQMSMMLRNSIPSVLVGANSGENKQVRRILGIVKAGIYLL